MTNDKLLAKYPDAELESTGDMSNLEQQNETRYKLLAPLFENLYENKMIYNEGGYTGLIKVENLVITQKKISATAKHILTVYNDRPYRGLRNLPQQWTFSGSWAWLRICGKAIAAYSCWAIWIEPNFVKSVEQLLLENKNIEAYNILWE